MLLATSHALLQTSVSFSTSSGTQDVCPMQFAIVGEVMIFFWPIQ